MIKGALEKEVECIPSAVTYGHTVMVVVFEGLAPSPNLKNIPRLLQFIMPTCRRMSLLVHSALLKGSKPRVQSEQDRCTRKMKHGLAGCTYHLK